MRPFFTSLLIGLFFVTAAVAAEIPPLETVINTLEQNFRDTAGDKKITGFQGEFLQTTKIASLNRKRTGRGQVAFAFIREDGKPQTAQFRWDYVEPEKQSVISDGKKLWIYTPENRQVIESDVSFTDPKDNPLAFVTGLGNLKRDFEISWGEPQTRGAGDYVLSLTPRQPSSMIQKLELVVRKQAVTSQGKRQIFPLRESVVFDSTGNSTVLHFRQIRINPELDDHFFTFTIPVGTRVMRPADGGRLF